MSRIKLTAYLEATRGVRPENSQEEQLTLSGVFSSFRYALPIDKKSQWNGRTFYLFRLGCAWSGLQTALMSRVAWWLFSLIPGSWPLWLLVEARILSDAFIRILRTKQYLDFFQASSTWHFWNYAYWISTVLVIHVALPLYWRATASNALSPFLMGLIGAAVQYFESDEPLGWQRISLVAQTDVALSFCLSTWLLEDWRRILSWARWIVFWAVDMTIYEMNYQIFGWGSGLTIWWELSKKYRATLEICLLALLLVLPWVIYLWLQRISVETRNQWLQTYPMARTIYSAWLQTSNYLDLVDALDSYIYYDWILRFQRSSYLQAHARVQELQLPLYEYTPLKPGHIRLLYLHKATLSGLIEGQLVEVPITDDVPYEALSYRWGSSELTKEIVVSGRRLAVTESACELLLARQSYIRDRLLWIDAICIDQQDQVEKASQVAMMSEIYRRAFRVVVYPGATTTYRMAAPLLYQLGAEGSTASPSDLGLVSPFLNEKADLQFRWRILVSLLEEEYFTRAWIVQEVACGKDVQLLLGGIYVPWKVFYVSVCKLNTPEYGPLMMQKSAGGGYQLACSSIQFVGALRDDSISTEMKPESELHDLASLLVLTSDFKSKDPRDKIFCVAGMTPEFQNTSYLRIDYTKTIEEVLTDAGKELLIRPLPAINMLAFAGLGHKKDVKVPHSWVPNLSSRSCIPLTDSLTKFVRFRAGGLTARVVQKQPGQIEVVGRVCDTILHLDEALILPDIVAQPETKENFIPSVLERMDAALAMFERYRHMLRADSNLDLVLTADAPGSPSMPSGVIRMIRDVWLDADTLVRGANESLEQATQRAVDWHFRYTKLQIPIACLHRAWAGRRFAITSTGRLCLVPEGVEAGDTVCVFGGAQVPYIVRKSPDSDDDARDLIGECYVQGIMQGEALDAYPETEILLQ